MSKYYIDIIGMYGGVALSVCLLGEILSEFFLTTRLQQGL